jgi:hypothetical protein
MLHCYVLLYSLLHLYSNQHSEFAQWLFLLQFIIVTPSIITGNSNGKALSIGQQPPIGFVEVGVGVTVCVGVCVGLAVEELVGVTVGVVVLVGVDVGVGGGSVGVLVGVGVNVGVLVTVAVGVGVVPLGVNELMEHSGMDEAPAT